jgi:hypothetical protein
MKSRILSTDEIVAMTDEELARRIASLNGFINREIRRGNRNSEIEIEMCYLYRESEVRNQRREAHETWLKNGGIASLDEMYEENEEYYA